MYMKIGSGARESEGILHMSKEPDHRVGFEEPLVARMITKERDIHLNSSQPMNVLLFLVQHGLSRERWGRGLKS
jgi:hypothetical protein